jgi:general secretion pathway protein M
MNVQILNRLSVYIRPWRERFHAMPANDRRALLLMVTVVVASLAYLALSSSRAYQQRALSYYQDAREDYRWIMVNLDTLKKVATSESQPTASAASTDNSLIGIATGAAKPFNVTFKRYQPEGDTGLRLWVEAAEFDQVLRWIDALSSQGVTLEQFDVDKLEKQVGLVDARVLLRRD